MKSILLLSFAALMHGQIALAQIDVGELAPAAELDVGTRDITSGGLDLALWQGTSADMAVTVLRDLPITPRSKAVTDIIDSVILSGGTPPEGKERETFRVARKNLILKRGHLKAFDDIVARTPRSGDGNALREMKADRALLGGDGEAACLTADTITEGRTEIYWSRLRAFCHAVRDETAAAELTADLLVNSGYEDPAFFAVLNAVTGRGSVSKAKAALKDGDVDSLVAIMASDVIPGMAKQYPLPAVAALKAQDTSASPEDRLAALMASGQALGREEASRVLLDLAVPSEAAADPSSGFFAQGFDFDSAKTAPGAQAYGQLFTLTQAAGNPQQAAKSAAALLELAQKDGHFERVAEIIAPNIRTLPTELQVAHGLDVFVRAAAGQGDTNALRGLYQGLNGVTPENPDYAKRDRLALASDAIGNGFTYGPLGADIEARLMKTGSVQRRAVRDTFIAAAMGATLSDAAIKALSDAPRSQAGRDIDPADLMILKSVAKRGSRAETALRVAVLIGNDRSSALSNRSLAGLIEALQIAGLGQFAGRLAAEDFLDL